MALMAVELLKGLNEQIHREYAASAVYRQAYHWFDLHLYPGTAQFFAVNSYY